MPTVILLDVSLSMTRPIPVVENPECTRKQLAIAGINAFLDQLSIHNKLEFISLDCQLDNPEVITSNTTVGKSLLVEVPYDRHAGKVVADNE